MKFADAINEVRNRVNIVDIIGQSVRLKRAGNNYMGLCPFHNEKTPSFVVSETKQIFKCFGCGKGGNVYTFLQEHDGLTFPEAVKTLAKKVNVTIDDDFRQNDQYIKKRDSLYNLYKDVANEYYKILYSDDGKKGLMYFEKRHLSKETIKRFGLGFAPKAYGYVYKKMKEKGYDDTLLMDSKLFYLSDKGPYDFFYDRVMFPLVDSYGNVVSFQGRVLEGDSQKYINTAESMIYKKSRHLFGINFARQTKEDFFILCEGNMDVITLHQAGFTNAVGSWGTAFTVEQANLIKRKVRKVYLCQDTDSAGIKAIEAASKICEDAGIETYVLDLSPAKDPDEFINAYGGESFKKKLESPIPSFLFLISILKRQLDLKNSYDYKKYIETIVKRLASIDNTLIRDKYVKDVAMQESLSYEDLLRMVEKYSLGNHDVYTEKGYQSDDMPNDSSDISKIEKALVSILLDNESYISMVRDVLKADEITDHLVLYIYNMLLDGKTANEIADLSNELPSDEKEEIQKIIFGNENLLKNDDKSDLKNILNELIRKIKKNRLSNANDLKATLLNNQLMLDIDKTIYIK